MNRFIICYTNREMPQVSKRALSKTQENRIFEILLKFITKLNNELLVSGFLNDFLTHTEKVMFAKRIAMALLISRGWNQTSISKYLKVSTSTISIIKSRLTLPGYSQIISQIENDHAWEQIWLEIQQALAEIAVGPTTTRTIVRKHYQAKKKKYEVM